MSLTTHTGGCHCGAVRFEADLDLDKPVSRCNCTICTKRGATGVIIKPEAFRLRSGDGELSSYGRHPEVGQYRFCSHCGIHVFGHGNLPQLGGAYVSINVNVLDGVEPLDWKVVYFDGRHDNWMAGVRDQPWPIASAHQA